MYVEILSVIGGSIMFKQKLVPLYEKGMIIDCDYLIFVRNFHSFEEIFGIPLIDGDKI